MDGRDVRLREIFLEIAKKHDFSILRMEIKPYYVHLYIECNPCYGITQCVSDLKRESASRLVKEFPEIRRKIPCMWTRNVFIATTGILNADQVQLYLEEQKGK